MLFIRSCTLVGVSDMQLFELSSLLWRECLCPQQIECPFLGLQYPCQGLLTQFGRKLLVRARLVITGVPHVCLDDGLQLIWSQPRGELGQEALERRAAEWRVRAVLPCHLPADV